jgi:hypothetical protein
MRPIANLCERWRHTKWRRGQLVMSPWGRDDVDAIHRMTESAAHFDLLVLGIWSETDQLVAMSVSEVLKSIDYGIIHFQKADTESYPGSFETMARETARALASAGCAFMNYGEDMGIPAIRTFKLSYRPTLFLKKYVVKPAGTLG